VNCVLQTSMRSFDTADAYALRCLGGVLESCRVELFRPEGQREYRTGLPPRGGGVPFGDRDDGYRALCFIERDQVFMFRVRGCGQAPVDPMDFA
jgi:hypothetical protein